MDLIHYILAGAAVGLAVGLTGVGGGSLMTPLLLMFGFPPHIAVGTDLLYATVTKSGGVIAHHKAKTIRWKISGAMAMGSLPAAALTSIALALWFKDASSYANVLTVSLGVMLMLTAVVLLFKKKLQQGHSSSPRRNSWISKQPKVIIFVIGIFLGVFVTLSSVGAGAIATAMLLIIYPRLPSAAIVGTDIAHAVPLTLVAGMGHLFLGHVDFQLLFALLVGSLPAVWLGTKLSTLMPDRVLHPLLATALMGLGIKNVFF